MGWDHLTRWPEPAAVTPAAVVSTYVDLVRSKVPSVRRIWAETRGHALWVATLIPPDRAAERRLHEVELELARRWPEVPIEFRVYREGEWLPPALKDGNLLVFAA